MAITIITMEELYKFKVGLLEDIEKLFEGKYGKKAKTWIRTKELREILGISYGTLQNLRINGDIPYSKIGSTFYYDRDKVLTVLENNEKVQNYKTKKI